MRHGGSASTTILTIDLGTSGVKAAVVGADGCVRGAGRAAVTTEFGRDGAAEQSPDDVWAATVTACRAALAATDATTCAGVIASSQYSSLVAVDADGRPTRPMVLWMDQRGSPKRLRKLGATRANPAHLADWYRRNGLAPVDAGLTLNHIRWLRLAEPDAYARTAALLEPMDYLALRLSGRATANRCTALMYLLTDNRAGGADAWHPALVAHAGVDAAKLPELVEPGCDLGPVLPDVADELGLAPGARVLSGLNDTQAGALAAGAATGPGAAVSIGTTAVIAARCDRFRADPRTSVFASAGPVPVDRGRFLMSAENGIAGGAVEHVSRLLYGTDVDPTSRYAALNADAAHAPPGSGGVLFLPWVRGALAPSADGRMRGGLVNLGLEHDRAHLARALFEGVALNLRWLRGAAERFAGRPFAAFTAYGGGAQSDLWCQVLADVLAAPVRQLDQPGHANCIGVGLFGLARLGELDPADIGERVPVRATYDPNAATAPVYDELAERFQDAFRRTRPLFHALYDARRTFRAAGPHHSGGLA